MFCESQALFQVLPRTLYARITPSISSRFDGCSWRVQQIIPEENTLWILNITLRHRQNYKLWCKSYKNSDLLGSGFYMILNYFCSLRILPWTTDLQPSQVYGHFPAKGLNRTWWPSYFWKVTIPLFVSAEPVMAEKPDFFYEDFANGATVIGNWQGKVKVSLRTAIN